MGFLVDAGVEAVGSVKPWLRATAAIALPGNWVILDGSTLVDPDSMFNGNTLPDLRDKFLSGHPTLTNANFGADANYRTSGGGTIPTGGVASHNLQHNHPGGAHTHSVAGHTHSIDSELDHTHTGGAHTHGAGSHQHSISSDGTHTHSGVTPGSTPGGAFLFTTTPTNSAGAHSHGGSTGTSGGSTASAGAVLTAPGGTHSHSGATGPGAGSSGAASGNTDDALSSIDNRPPFTGLVMIMKVK